MKKVSLFYSLMAAIVLAALNHSVFGQCTARSIIKNCKSEFTYPYQYSGCWMQEFVIDKNYKRIEGHFVVLEGLKYQVVFCSSQSAENIIVNIYDKSIETTKKRILYDSSKNKGSNLWKFEPTSSGDYYVEYIIPPTTTGKAHTGCVMLMLGTVIELEGN